MVADAENRLLTTALTNKKPAPRRVIIRYKTGQKKETINAMTRASKQRAAGEPEIQVAYDFDDLNAFVVSAMEDEIAVLVNSPEVEAIEDDPIRFPMSIEGSNADLTEFFANGSRQLQETTPVGIDLVQAPDVWAQGVTGKGVKVCVIDTGIDQEHPDFITSNLSGPGNNNANNRWYEDGCGHGTHVAGTIAAENDNKGVVGVAPDADIFTVRVFGENCGIIFGSSLINAARECKDNGAKIISMSLGGPVRNFFEEWGFNQLVNRDDMLIVAAAGNAGDTSKSYPASYNTVMSVAAVDFSKEHAVFSQRNNQVDIAAPGVDILSTFPLGGCEICQDNTDGYGAISGTSMATPHVSGVAALLMSAFPDAPMDDIRDALEASAEDLGSAGRDNLYGHGFVQAKAALRILQGDDPIPPIGVCADFPEDWNDQFGSFYDCAWYAEGSNCERFGDDYANDGKTANEACCACGGGSTV